MIMTWVMRAILAVNILLLIAVVVEDYWFNQRQREFQADWSQRQSRLQAEQKSMEERAVPPCREGMTLPPGASCYLEMPVRQMRPAKDGRI